MNLSNIQIILVGPVYAGNVGAAARSAKNYGISQIKIVGKLDYLCLDAKKMALYGFDLLENAKRYSTLQEAIQDTSLVIGTVHQARFNRTPPRPIWDVMEDHKDRFKSESVAIVFGREDNGLNRDEIDQCHFLATIPTPNNLSFNLAHSVTVFLYEINRCIHSIERSLYPRRPNQGEMEEAFKVFRDTMDHARFFKGKQEASVMTQLRDIAFRSQINAADLPLVKAVFYKIHKYFHFIENPDE